MELVPETDHFKILEDKVGELVKKIHVLKGERENWEASWLKSSASLNLPRTCSALSDAGVTICLKCRDFVLFFVMSGSAGLIVCNSSNNLLDPA